MYCQNFILIGELGFSLVKTWFW